MNKIVLFLAIPCVIAIALSAMEVEGFVYGMQTPMFGAQQQSYRSQQLLAIAQRNRLNNLARVSEFSKFVNYIPLVLLLTTLTNTSSIPIIG